MASTTTRIDLTSGTITPFENNATAREAVTTTDNNGVKSILGKHGRDSETSSELGDKGDEDGAAAGGTMGLRTDFDLPKQVSL